MPGTLITKTMPEGAWDEEGVALTWTNLDNANGNYFPSHRDCFLLAWNTDASPQTFCIDSEPLPPSGRTGHIAEVMAAGEIRVFRLAGIGWADADGNTNLPAGQNANLKVALFPVDPLTG